MAVINKYHHGNTVPDGSVSIMRGSPFGNPYVIGKDGDRDEVIAKYRVWLWHKMKDSEFRKKLLSLDGLDLCCCCKPKRCHGDIILSAIEYLKSVDK